MAGSVTTAGAGSLPGAAAGVREVQVSWADARAVLIALLTITPLAAASGGYWPTAWSWSSLALLWVAGLALVLRVPALGRLEIGTLGAVLGLLTWVAASTLWSSNVGQTVSEVQRLLVYVAGLAAALLLLKSSSYKALLIGAWGATTLVCGYALLTRLFPERLGFYDPIAGYRLSEPLGYWNGLGILAAIGSVLALGLAAHAKSLVVRAIAAASLLLTMPALYFTFSRGVWIALACGLIAMFLFDKRRLELATAGLVLAPFVAVAVWRASSSSGLTRLDSSLELASRDGHRLAVTLAGLAGAAAVSGMLLGVASRRLSFSTGARRGYAVALGIAALAVVIGLFAHYGSPTTLARKAYDSYTAPVPRATTDLNQRLFTLASPRRLLWAAAWHDFEAHPALGAGAGTFERFWLENRTSGEKVRDAHSLYLETLAELGPIGLALLVAVLALPAVAAARARDRRLVAPALGAYVVFLLHAGIDWDWEMPAVTLLGLFCGTAILLAARSRSRPVHLPVFARGIGVAAAVALTVFAFFGLLGNRALSAANAAADSRQPRKQESKARQAVRWAPWSSEAWRLVAEGQYAQGDLAGARASLRRALEKDPDDWQVWFNLAAASRGRERAAAIARARRLNPLSP
ncbi:MAG: O-antigen ligase family protein, partial [Gaiellaceae bacterium]